MLDQFKIDYKPREYIVNIKYDFDKNVINNLIKKYIDQYKDINKVKLKLRDYFYKTGKYQKVLECLSSAFDDILKDILNEYKKKIKKSTKGTLIYKALEETVDYLKKNKWGYIKIYDIVTQGLMAVTVQTFDINVWARKVSEKNIHRLYIRKQGYAYSIDQNRKSAVRLNYYYVPRLNVYVNYWAVTPEKLLGAIEYGRTTSGIIKPYAQPTFIRARKRNIRQNLLIALNTNEYGVQYIFRKKSKYGITKKHAKIIFSAHNVISQKYKNMYISYLKYHLEKNGFNIL